ATAPQTAPATTVSATAPALVVNTNIPEELLVVTNENARYTFTSYGGGLKLVELVHYPDTVPNWREHKKAETNRFATLNAGAPKATLAVLNAAGLDDGIYTLS